VKVWDYLNKDNFYTEVRRRKKMETVNYTTTVEIPLEVMWDFIKDFDNWAPMIKGYESHEKIDAKKSVWMIRGEFGSFSRLTKFNNTITKWVEKEQVAFEMTGVNEPVAGGGSVALQPVNGGSGTQITADVGFHAGGALGPLINRMIKPLVLTVSEKLVENIIAAIDPETCKSAKRQEQQRVSLWGSIVAWFRRLVGA
jgi:carbon monoxide dehydrogenase subunit G